MTARTDEHPSWRYEREAEATRNRLAGNLDELSDRLTPGEMFDEVLTYARGGSGTLFRAFSNAARENPLPTLLIGAGCLMFLSEKTGMNRYLARRNGTDRSGRYEQQGERGTDGASARGAFEKATDAAASGLRSAASSVSDTAAGIKDQAAGAAAGIKDQVSGAAAGVKEQAASAAAGLKKRATAVGDSLSTAAQRMRETAHDLGDQAADTGEQIRRGAQRMGETVQDYSASIGEQVADTREQAARAVRQTQEAVRSFVNEQPLICAAIGLAVGAAIAAMLPSTEAEDELMGEASDKVKHAVGDTASEQFEAAKSAAGRVATEAMSTAQREGLTPAAAVDAAKQFGAKLETVAKETTEAAKSEASDLASTADSKDRR